MFCLKDVVLDIDPRVVQLGQESTLRCSYDLEGAPLYTVKWYRGHHEFYRYTPKELPSTKIFPFAGVHVDTPLGQESVIYPFLVDITTIYQGYHAEAGELEVIVPEPQQLKRSSEHQVVLREVGFNLSGNFSCEVTTDAPMFSTRVVSKDMLVVVLPTYPPTLTAEKSYYVIGDVLRANCSSPPSRPSATLTFVLNSMVVCERCVIRKHAVQELWWSDLSLELPLFPSHFENGRLTLKCVAQIGDLYQQDAEINLYNDKDPVPARVTQNSSSSATSIRTSPVGLAVILYLVSRLSRLFC